MRSDIELTLKLTDLTLIWHKTLDLIVRSKCQIKYQFNFKNNYFILQKIFWLNWYSNWPIWPKQIDRLYPAELHSNPRFGCKNSLRLGLEAISWEKTSPLAKRVATLQVQIAGNICNGNTLQNLTQIQDFDVNIHWGLVWRQFLEKKTSPLAKRVAWLQVQIARNICNGNILQNLTQIQDFDVKIHWDLVWRQYLEK